MFFAVMLVVGVVGIVVGIARLIVPEWRVNHGFVEHACKVVERRGRAGARARRARSIGPEIKIEYEVAGRHLLAVHVRHPLTLPSRSTRRGPGGDRPFRRPRKRAPAGTIRPIRAWPCSSAATNGGSGRRLLVPVSFIAIGVGGLIYTMP